MIEYGLGPYGGALVLKGNIPRIVAYSNSFIFRRSDNTESNKIQKSHFNRLNYTPYICVYEVIVGDDFKIYHNPFRENKFILKI
jgi:hypothetical protein